MFNKSVLAGVCLMALTCGAQAADSVDLKVTGTLVNGSCTPSLENGGVVDFGHIPLGNLNKTTANQIGYKIINLTISCDSAMPIGWNTVDNRANSVVSNLYPDALANKSPAYVFGLGMNGDKKMGNYSISVDPTLPVADGVSAHGIYCQSQTGNNCLWTDLAVRPQAQPSIRTITVAKDSTDLTPLAFKTAVFPLKIAAVIDSTDNLAITDDTNLDGSATIALVYL